MTDAAVKSEAPQGFQKDGTWVDYDGVRWIPHTGIRLTPAEEAPVVSTRKPPAGISADPMAGVHAADPTRAAGLKPLAEAPAPSLDPCEVHLASPQEITENWPLIHTGCVAIKTVNGTGIHSITPSGSWTPQHIREGLLVGQPPPYELYGAFRVGKLRGFGITMMCRDPYNGSLNSALVFLAFKDPSEKSDAYARVANHIAEVMRARGVSYLEAVTRREDLAAHSAYLGWVSAGIIMRLPLWES